ncbi:unnamed protein product [Schistosoma turkestanicum]|nr:unnamed protein product [Schistosoma turkestanicum]
MVIESDDSFPARQLFTHSSNCSTDKALLTKIRQQEAENAMRLSAERLRRMYDFNTDHVIHDYTSNTPSYISDHSHTKEMSKNLPKSFSTPTIKVNNNENENSRSCDQWQWEIISTENQYIPTFYLSKQYYSDSCITATSYGSTPALQTPMKQKSCTKTGKDKKEMGELLVSQHRKLLKTNADVSKKNKYIPTRINTWNLPVKKWSHNFIRSVKHAPANHILGRSYSLTKLNSLTVNKTTASNSNFSHRTINSLEDLLVDDSTAVNSHVKYGMNKHESMKNRKFTYATKKYRQTTLLEILPKWREQAEKLHLLK